MSKIFRKFSANLLWVAPLALLGALALGLVQACAKKTDPAATATGTITLKLKVNN